MALSDYMMSYINSSNEVSDMAPNILPPKHLKFNIKHEVYEAIYRGNMEIDILAEDLMLRLAEDLMLRVFYFKEYGKNFIKSQRLSPDAYIQMVIQLAYYRLHKMSSATYESGSRRRFQQGRTETIRSCSSTSLAFTEAMDDLTVTKSMKVNLLKKAIQAHRNYTDEVNNGHGIDRHLLGLKLIAVENGMEIPEIYTDSAFKESSTFRISTSQVPSRHTSYFSFGAPEADGYGLCYNPQENEIIFAITSYHHNMQTNSNTFCDSLRKSFLDIQTFIGE